MEVSAVMETSTPTQILLSGAAATAVEASVVVPEPSSPTLPTPQLPICGACVEGWLSKPEDGEPDRASVIWTSKVAGEERTNLYCGFHSLAFLDDLPAIRLYGVIERGRRVG